MMRSQPTAEMIINAAASDVGATPTKMTSDSRQGVMYMPMATIAVSMLVQAPIVGGLDCFARAIHDVHLLEAFDFVLMR
jgi:hypothetical protein